MTDQHPYLTQMERSSYLAYSRTDPASLAISTQAQLFELYLHGKTCEDIHTLNPALPLGAIVAACIEGGWYQQRQEHISGLFDAIRERVTQVQLESINFIADALSAAHKEQGERVLKYLQTGNNSHLDKAWVRSFKQYREALEILMKLTGQEDKGNKSPTVKNFFNIQKDGVVEDSQEIEGTVQEKPLLTGWSPKMAADVLEVLEREGEIVDDEGGDGG